MCLHFIDLPYYFLSLSSFPFSFSDVTIQMILKVVRIKILLLKKILLKWSVKQITIIIKFPKIWFYTRKLLVPFGFLFPASEMKLFTKSAPTTMTLPIKCISWKNFQYYEKWEIINSLKVILFSHPNSLITTIISDNLF